MEDGSGVLLDCTVAADRAACADPTTLEAAGPRRKLFFDPANVRAGIVTCGGLCPGLNDVIRGVTMVLWYRYGVRNILGFRYGYQGLVASCGQPPIHLSPERVEDILIHPSLPVDVRHNAKISREKLAVWAAERLSKTNNP